MKKWISPPKQTKRSDNSNIMLMFNNNIYADFRTAHNYVIQVFYKNQNVTKLHINWFFGWGRPRLTFEIWNWTLKTTFYFTKSFFWQKHSKPLQANICGRNTYFFSNPPPPFQNLGLTVVPPPAERGALYCQGGATFSPKFWKGGIKGKKFVL